MRKIIGMASITFALALPISACQFDGRPVFDENTEHDVYFFANQRVALDLW